MSPNISKEKQHLEEWNAKAFSEQTQKLGTHSPPFVQAESTRLAGPEIWQSCPVFASQDSVLYTLKVYAETYGEGKATKMPWWDWLRASMQENLLHG
eukprot:3062175-Amphidinium_carterae.1